MGKQVVYELRAGNGGLSLSPMGALAAPPNGHRGMRYVLPKNLKWFLLAKVFGLIPQEVASIDGKTTNRNVSSAICRLAQGVWDGEVDPRQYRDAHDFTRFLPRSNTLARRLTFARAARPGSPRIETIQADAPLRWR